MLVTLLLLFSCLYNHATSGPVSRCECGVENISTRIIRGSKSPDGMFPWLVYIETEVDIGLQTVSSSCTGSIISDRHILTAAHCLHPNQEARGAYVWLFQGCGKKRKSATISPLHVIRVHRHPKYEDDDDELSDHDLAIFELRNPLKFNQTFMPVCFSKAGFTRTRDIDNLVAAGWGKTHGILWGLTDSECLQHADLAVVSDKECRSHWGDGLDMTKRMCAGGGVNICDGDSGGPLMTRSHGRVFQVGVTSFGRQDCGLKTGTPSGFERISAHLDWIKKITSKGQGICFK